VSLDLEDFRDLFPALQRFIWLNTPTAAPGARPVVEALHRAEMEWERGEFSWQAWEADAYATRSLFARLIGAPDDTVALVGSVAEAAAIVASSLPPGRVVVGSREFQSNFLPWLALRRRGWEVIEVPAEDGAVSTGALAAEIDRDTALVAVSEVQSSNGYRIDVSELAARCRDVGARLFVNLTQALGALSFDASVVRPDFVTASGYKWLLGPRGASWLHVHPDRRAELSPLIPNWHSVEEPYADYYGGSEEIASGTRGLDTSFSWLPWVGARPALELVGSLDPGIVEKRCLDLTATFRQGVRDLGFEQSPEEVPSQIVAVSVPDADQVRARLKERRVMAAVRAGSIRFGFHAFNDESDVDAALGALGRARAR
jgi:selenocysteine lyase/cysteine desulfurase